MGVCGEFSITKYFSQGITGFYTPTRFLGALPFPLGRGCMSGSVTVVLGDFSMAIVLSWIAISLLRGGFCAGVIILVNLLHGNCRLQETFPHQEYQCKKSLCPIDNVLLTCGRRQ